MADDLFQRGAESVAMGDDERLSWLRLIRSRRVGVTTFFRLLGEHGAASAALAALPEVAKNAGVSRYEACSEKQALAEMRAGKKAGARLVCHCDADYPADLRDIPDAPPVLWVRGNVAMLHRPMIALVGARNASSLGTRMAKRLARELGEAGFCIVSGLARGVDAAAHVAALPTGTVGVMAGGVDVIYPRENQGLADQVLKQGALLSEQPMGMQPMARHFPMRNRIISGMCQAVVVVEAALKSGSLITARNALDQGREVMAVPGHPIDSRASGCNALIRDGAALVRSAADVVEALQQPASAPSKPEHAPPEAPRRHPPRRNLAETAKLHGDILNRLSPSPLAEDQLIRDLNLPAKQINPALTTLELEGRIERRAGGLLSLVQNP